jgi:hypothetical protein
MLTRETLTSLAIWNSNVSMTHLALFILLLMPLAGCTNDGSGGPVISSLSAPADATVGLESDQGASSEAVHSGGEGGEEDPVITMISTEAGVTAHLTWEPPSDITVAGYSIHYGKRPSEEPNSEESMSEGISSEELSSEEPNSCARGESQLVKAPSATITELEPNTLYFFVIRAFNESESLCSNEITAVTPSTQS